MGEVYLAEVGEGLGHATRSAVVLERLLFSGHEVKVVVSGRAHAFLRDRFSRRKGWAIEEIDGETQSHSHSGMSLVATVRLANPIPCV